MVCGAAMIVVTLALTLKEQNREFALLVSFTGGILLLGAAVREATPVMTAVTALAGRIAHGGEAFTVLLKAVGIALCTQFTADACRDAGESGIAHKAELCGRVMIAVVSLPIFEEVLALVETLFENF